MLGLLILFQLFQSALDHIHMNIALYKHWNIIIIIMIIIIIIIIRLIGGLISSGTCKASRVYM